MNTTILVPSSFQISDPIMLHGDSGEVMFAALLAAFAGFIKVAVLRLPLGSVRSIQEREV